MYTSHSLYLFLSLAISLSLTIFPVHLDIRARARLPRIKSNAHAPLTILNRILHACLLNVMLTPAFTSCYFLRSRGVYHFKCVFCSSKVYNALATITHPSTLPRSSAYFL